MPWSRRRSTTIALMVRMMVMVTADCKTTSSIKGDEYGAKVGEVHRLPATSFLERCQVLQPSHYLRRTTTDGDQKTGEDN